MIVQNPDRPEGTLEFTVSGRVTAADYETVLIPAIEKALDESDRIRVLVRFADDFEGYSLEAAWDDTKLGLRHWRGFDRAAVVADDHLVRMAMKAFSFAFPCPLRTFPAAELEEARLWLAEDLGTIHVRKLGGNGLAVQLIGQVDSAAYDRAADEIDAFIAEHGRIRLLVDLREFDGWQGISALSEHLSLVRDHRHAPEKVAVAGVATWQHLAEKVFSRFLDAETRYFQGAEMEDVERWLREG
jgi:hypothetical protein